MKKLLAALSILLSTTMSQAAEIKHGVSNNIEYIIIEGQIGDSDSKIFAEIFDKNPRTKAIFLNSNGGLVYEGMVIAGIVNHEKLDTFILNGKVCFSICAPIFFSGNRKFIQKEAMLGVHPAHENNSDQKSAEGNALIAWYFGRLGYDLGLVELWISADTKSLNYITADINQKLGLGIISIDQ